MLRPDRNDDGLPTAKLSVLSEAEKQTDSEQKRHQGNGANALCAFSATFACGMTEASPQLAELVFRKTPGHLCVSADILAKYKRCSTPMRKCPCIRT